MKEGIEGERKRVDMKVKNRKKVRSKETREKAERCTGKDKCRR